MAMLSGDHREPGKICGKLTQGADRMLGNSPIPAPDICSHNYFQNSAKGVTGGIVNNNNITGADPGFVNPASDWSLTSESILKDKGPTEAQFNDS